MSWLRLYLLFLTAYFLFKALRLDPKEIIGWCLLPFINKGVWVTHEMHIIYFCERATGRFLWGGFFQLANLERFIMTCN